MIFNPVVAIRMLFRYNATIFSSIKLAAGNIPLRKHCPSGNHEYDVVHDEYYN